MDGGIEGKAFCGKPTEMNGLAYFVDMGRTECFCCGQLFARRNT